MEFKKLSSILNIPNFRFQSLDYLYLHNKDSYPIQKEMDFENFYFVIKSSGLTVEVIGVISGIEKKLNLTNNIDNWWFFRLSEQILNKLNTKK